MLSTEAIVYWGIMGPLGLWLCIAHHRMTSRTAWCMCCSTLYNPKRGRDCGCIGDPRYPVVSPACRRCRWELEQERRRESDGHPYRAPSPPPPEVHVADLKMWSDEVWSGVEETGYTKPQPTSIPGRGRERLD